MRSHVLSQDHPWQEVANQVHDAHRTLIPYATFVRPRQRGLLLDQPARCAFLASQINILCIRPRHFQALGLAFACKPLQRSQAFQKGTNMTLDVYVTGDIKFGKVAFVRRTERDVCYRIDVPPGALCVVSARLVLGNGDSLSAFDVYVYAKAQLRGFRMLSGCEEADNALKRTHERPAPLIGEGCKVDDRSAPARFFKPLSLSCLRFISAT
jgi:hypothetical protein